MAEKKLYRVVLNSAWITTWQNKKLWLWGLFAALLGNAGEYELIVTAVSRVASREIPPLGISGGVLFFPMGPQVAGGLWSAFTTEPFSVFMLFLIGLIVVALAIFFIWLTMVSVVALVQSTAAIAADDGVPTVSENIDAGSLHFGSILIIYIFGRLLTWTLLSLLVLLGALAGIDAFIGLPFLLTGFVVVLPLLFAISFVVRYAMLYVILRRQGIMDAMESAIALFQRHWLISLELSFFLFVVNLMVGIAMVIFIGLLAAPMLIGAIIAWQTAFYPWAFLLGAFGVTMFLAILFLFGSALGTYQWAAWTHLFLKLKERGHLSKLVRFFSRFADNRPVNIFPRS